MNIWRHFKEQPFVVFVALAALPHSTWTIGTYMSGFAPVMNGWQSVPEFVGWLFPALALSFSMDVGLVATAGEIRAGNKSKWLVYTFYALSFASYILQFLFVIHHAPSVAVGGGASPIVAGIGIVIQQVGIFVLPAFLPGATIFYTLAHHETQPQNEHSIPLNINQNGANLNDTPMLGTPTHEEVSERPFLPLFAKNGHTNHAQIENGTANTAGNDYQ